MPAQFTLPPDTRVIGGGNPPADMNAITDAVTAMGAGMNVLNTAYAGGADPTGAADSTAAIQAAITAAQVTGETVYFPAGQYTISSALTLTSTVRLTGAGIGSGIAPSRGTLLKTGSGGGAFHMFTFPSGAVSGLEIDHMTINHNVTAGGDMFHEVAAVDSHFHDLQFNQNNAAGSVLQMTGTQSFLNVLIERCNFGQNTSTRSVPLISLSNGASGAFSNITFFKCKFSNNGSGGVFDNTQYLVYLACTAGTAGYHYYETFRDCWFEHPYGGCVKSLSGSDAVFDACAVWDIFSGSGGTVGNSLYYVGAAGGGSGSQNTAWRNCGRNRNGPDGSATWDIYCESTTISTLVEGYGIKPDTASTLTNVFFNFNSHPDVILLGNAAPQGSAVNGNSTTVVTNPGTSCNQVGPGPLAENPGAQANGLLAWSWDPGLNGTNATGTIAIGGTLYLIAFTLHQPTVLNKIWWFNTAVAITPTSGQSQAGIYNSAGTLVASATAAATATGSTTANAVSVSLSAAYTAPPGTYWIGLVFQAATEPTILRSAGNNAGIANLGIAAAANFRVCVNGTAITTALPGSITPSANTQTGAICYWAGVS